MRRWFDLLRTLAQDTRQRAAGHDLALVAAGLALYAGIAVVPLLLLGLYGAGLVVGVDQVSDIVRRLSEFAPKSIDGPALVRLLGDVGPRLGVPSLIASIVTATTYGEGLLRAVDMLEGSQRDNRTVAGRIRALPYLGVFPLVTVLGLVTLATLPGALGGGTLGQLIGVYLTFWIGWLSASVLLIVLYRLFAGRALHWIAIAGGALTAGSFLAGMSLGWVFALRAGVSVGRAYGGSEPLGRVILFAVYLLLVQMVVLLGYLLVLSINDHMNRTSHADDPTAHADDRTAPRSTPDT